MIKGICLLILFSTLSGCLDMGDFISNHYLREGRANERENNYEMALENYEKAIRYNPENKIAWMEKGSALFNLKKYDRSIEAAEKAIALDPNYSEAYFVKAGSHQAKGEYNESIHWFKKTVELNSTDYFA